jgi:hypothetical protein
MYNTVPVLLYSSESRTVKKTGQALTQAMEMKFLAPVKGCSKAYYEIMI